ncbi:MAG: hypothetical protein JWN62_738, partial [Acidimicrobiales bacterium]|nr:hypothetical protein [Acidimicrobiales bacterium]
APVITATRPSNVSNGSPSRHEQRQIYCHVGREPSAYD